MTVNKTVLRNRVTSKINDWGGQIRVRRFSGTRTSSGRQSGTFVSAATVTGWIQPYQDTGFGRVRQPGVIAETTHMMFLPWDAISIGSMNTRLLPIADTYAYDVLGEMVLDTHKEYRLKLVPRT